MVKLHSDLHFRQGVAHIGGVQLVDANGLGVIALYGDYGHAFALVVRVELVDSLFVHLSDGAVIASEDHHEYLVGGIIGQPVNGVVYAREGEIRSRRAKSEGGVARLRKCGRTNKEK
jgi:hypothetical protein